MGWEYRYEEVPCCEGAKFEAHLNKRGAAGWELVSWMQGTRCESQLTPDAVAFVHMLIFKRVRPRGPVLKREGE